MSVIDIISKHPYYALVEHNVYDIPQRLKEIDSSYFVVWNNREGRFEVHSTENIGNTYCFTVPYPELDCRTLQYARETSVQRGMKIREKMKKDRIEREKMIDRERRRMFEDTAGEVFEKALHSENARIGV